jgi:transcriptional regulator with XRE-family HTH domain
MNTGERIRALRSERGLSVTDLALIIGKDKSAVSRWETGDVTNLTSNPLLKMSEYFNVSIDYILCRTDERYDRKATLTTIFNNLNEENKMKAVAYLKELEVMQGETTESKRNGKLHETKKRKVPLEENR